MWSLLRARDEQVRDGQVGDENIGDGLHALCGQHHVDYQAVTANGRGEDERVGKQEHHPRNEQVRYRLQKCALFDKHFD